MRVELWADLVCPFCYLGKHRLDRALASFAHRGDVELVHRAFQLDASAPRGKMLTQLDVLMAKYRMSEPQVRAMQQRLEATAAADGLTLRLVGGNTGNTFDAHRLALFAHERGLQQPMLERLYRAQFTEQVSIFDRAALSAFGVEVGLDATDVGTLLEGDAYADVVRADGERARQLGVTGVPFLLVAGSVVVGGAQPLATFERALAEGWARSA